jgi:Putative zinc-finger
MNCLSENTLRAYHDGELTPAERSEMETHLSNCSTCREHLHEVVAAAGRVRERLLSLHAAGSETSIDPQIALARFEAQHGSGAEGTSFLSRLFAPSRSIAWIAGAIAAILLVGLAFPSGRSLAQRLLATLRVEKIQTVRLDLAYVDGNRPLQQMLGQIISDKVIVTADEKPQEAATSAAASQLAGFRVRLLGGRADSPQFNVEGQHAFHMTLDRARLQEIFDQAGRPDLLLPATIDGATISVQIPRSVQMRYGDCPSEHNAEGAAPHDSSLFANCTILAEAPSPVVNVPSDLNLQQLAEIGFQLTGMSATQAREFCQTIDWKTTLVLPIPRGVDSHSQVEVDGVQGTLIHQSLHGAPGYVLIWVKNGIIYFLAAHGNSEQAVTLANSLD